MVVFNLTSRIRSFGLYACLFLLFLFFTPGVAKAEGRGVIPSQVPNVQLVDRDRYVSDMSAVLDRQSLERVDSACADLRQRYGLEVAIVLLDAIDHSSYTIETFANELYGEWGLGQKGEDFGLLIVSEMMGEAGSRDFRMETGYGAEALIPDALAMQIAQHEIFPRFRRGDVTGGLLAALKSIDQTLTRAGYRKGEDMRAAFKTPSREPLLAGGQVFLFLGIYFFVSFFFFFRVLWGVNSRLQSNEDSQRHLLIFHTHAIAPSVFLFFLPAWPFYCVWYKRKERQLMRKAHACPYCGTHAHRDSSVLVLNEGQRMEQSLGTASHQAFVCDHCGRGFVVSFPKNLSVHECPSCHYYTAIPVRRENVARGTTFASSPGLIQCHYCNHRFEEVPQSTDFHRPSTGGRGIGGVLYYILMLLIQAIFFGGRGGRGGGGWSGGSSGGGSWGGGSSGGGGYSGRW